MREHLYISSTSFPDSCLVYEGSEAASLPAPPPPPRASLAGVWVAGTALARIAAGQRGTGVGELGQPPSFTLLGLPLTSASPWVPLGDPASPFLAALSLIGSLQDLLFK